jgi:hypothetical protein
MIMVDSSSANSTHLTASEANLRWTWRNIEEALRSLQFGSVTLLVQDGIVIQVERTERKRYGRSARTPNGTSSSQ